MAAARPQRFALTAATMGGPKLLQDISAGGLLSTGEYVIADRELRGAYRFSSAGQYLAAFASRTHHAHRRQRERPGGDARRRTARA